jgi:hypothetical protein
MDFPISYDIVKRKTLTFFEREHRYILNQIYNRITRTANNISYNDFVNFAYDQSTIDLKTSLLYKKYNNE